MVLTKTMHAQTNAINKSFRVRPIKLNFHTKTFFRNKIENLRREDKGVGRKSSWGERGNGKARPKNTTNSNN